MLAATSKCINCSLPNLIHIGNREICELLVKKGANTDISDNLGHTAAWLAIDAGHTAVKHAIEGNEESLEPKLAATLEVSL